jgi:hypothetical protein
MAHEDTATDEPTLRVPEDMTEYEVRCPTCDVSFPPETRVCFYCGGKTGSSRNARSARRSLLSRTPRVASGPVPRDAPFPDGVQIEERFLEVDPGRYTHVDGAEEIVAEREMERTGEEPTIRGTLPRILSSVAWVLLIVAVSVYRACTST